MTMESTTSCVGDAETENTFEKVAAADKEFRANAAKAVVDPDNEVAALTSLFDPPLCHICEKTLGTERWSIVQGKYKSVLEKSSLQGTDLGNTVIAVTESLDAPHLLPSGIRERLEKGIAPAGYGLLTLIDNLSV